MKLYSRLDCARPDNFSNTNWRVIRNFEYVFISLEPTCVKEAQDHCQHAYFIRNTKKMQLFSGVDALACSALTFIT